MGPPYGKLPIPISLGIMKIPLMSTSIVDSVFQLEGIEFGVYSKIQQPTDKLWWHDDTGD